MKTEAVETVIVGGGQAGFSLSYFLQQAHRENLVLEKSHRPGSAWTEQRWDSFTLVTPNWAFRLPGAEYQGNDPHGFMPRDEVAKRFEDYVSQQKLPVQYGMEVQIITPEEHGFLIVAGEKSYHARNVVIATGMFQRGKIPEVAKKFPSGILQIHAGHYRNPDALPAGAVLVVGSGQSGCQIAEELHDAGRKVYLSVGGAGRFPRRYRGRDGFDWGVVTGFFDRTPDKLPSPAARFGGNPHLTGKNGGHNLNLHQFHRDGIVLLGHVCDILDGKLEFASDLRESLAKADKAEVDFLHLVDSTIIKQGLTDPPETYPVLTDGYSAPEILSLDINKTGIRTVIWACGFRFDYGMVKLPVFDEFGYPITQRGRTAFPGLYFLGMPWLHTQKSGNLFGVGEDAAYLAGEMVATSGVGKGA